MTYPYPTYVGAGRQGTSAPVVPEYLTGTAGAAGGLLASWGAQTSDTRVFRAFVQGPAGSRCDVFLGDGTPDQLVADRRYQVDYTLTGNADYANYDPPLTIPAGSNLVFRFTGGSTPTGGAVVRLETQMVG